MTHTKDEALKLALEALEGNTTNPVIDPDQAAIEDQAITAIKQALAQPAPVPAAQRPWLDLTDAQIKNIEAMALTKNMAIVMTMAALKELNI